MRPSIIIRVDGGQRVGLGHVVRMRALAEMLAKDFDCEFILGHSDPAVITLLSGDYRVHQLATGDGDVETILELARRKGAAVVVLDGYNFGCEMQRSLRQAGLRVVVIDDVAAAPIEADLVINHCSRLVARHYQVAPDVRLLCGPKYALLRAPFLAAARDAVRTSASEGTVLVCMGGTDSLGVTPRVLETLTATPWVKRVTVVLGPLAGINFHHGRQGHSEVEFCRDLDASGMVRAFQRSQLAVVTASSIAIEACAVGCGLLVGLVADNQRWVHEEVTTTGCAVSVGDWRTATPEAIARATTVAAHDAATMVAAQRLLLDGQSPERICDAFRSLAA
jgi:UDP-2,4-diacetamido-2,4,6-trideoxy-beta-L-altropyranose hydrolase